MPKQSYAIIFTGGDAIVSAMGEQLAARFLAHRASVRELADGLPDDAVDFRPWEGAMTAGEQLTHVGTAHRLMVTIAAGGGVQRPDPASLPGDLPGIRGWLDEMTAADAATLRGLTDEQLAAEQEGYRGIVLPAASWAHRAREHEIHHKGLLFAYARMRGLAPPHWMKM